MHTSLRLKLTPTLRAIALAALALFVLGGFAWAQTARDMVVDLTATTNSSAPYITLNWPAASGFTVTAQKLWRRVKGNATWDAPNTLNAADISYPDSTAQAGLVYEYSLQRTRSTTPTTAYGGIVAGYNAPLVDARGNLLLLVDSTMSKPVGSEITQLINDLKADGWNVRRYDVARATVAASSLAPADWPNRSAEQDAVRQLVQSEYNTAPTAEWALLILGHLPVVYSGDLGPDGHYPDHYGAWPTDGYYGDVDGTWTDSTVNVVTAGDPRNRNQPGDGKLDQSNFPSAIEMQVGRVDLSSMSGVPTGPSETTLLRQYLWRDHRFRRGLAPYNTVAARAILDDNFGYFGGEAFSQSSWSGVIGMFGRTTGQVDALDWFNTLGATPVLFAFGAGGGSYTSASGIGTSTLDFGRKDSKAVFTAMFGSYFGDWDISNNFLKSPLAGTQDSLGLTCMWSGRGEYHFHHLAMGDTIGYCLRYTQNSNGSTGAGDWFQNGFAKGVQTNLMGDPTLRLHTVRPPTAVQAISGTGVQVTWINSPDTVAGYHVYRSTSANGPFTRLTGSAPSATDPLGSPITGPPYTDANVSSSTTYYYQVKAVRLQTSQSGTYANQSLGETASVTYGSGAPAAPSRLTVIATSSTTRLLTWDDNASNETGYEVWRRNEANGAYTLYATLAADATTYTDSAGAAGSINHYKVRALGSVNSPFTDEAGDPNQPGITRVAQDYTLTSKAIGTLGYGVTRFSGTLGSASVNWAVADVLSSAGDYSSMSGTVNWAHGQATTQNATIGITNYGTPQLTKIFRVDLSGQAGALTGSPTTGYVQVYDPATQNAPPSGWSAATIGSVTAAGYNEYYNGAFGLSSVSGNIASTADGYTALQRQVTGDCRIVARLAARSNVAGATRAGIMIRSASGAGDPMCAMITTSSTAIQRAYRTASNGAADTALSLSSLTLPLWMRLTRTGDNVVLEYSSNGTTWTAFGTATTLTALGTSPYVSLVLASNTSAPAIYGYARFDNVLVNFMPSIPGASAAAGAQAGQITISWPAVNGADSYIIERTTTSGSGYMPVAQVSATAWTDADLTLGQTYYYHVRASNVTYQSAFSGEVSAQPLNPPTVDGWRYRMFGTVSNTGDAADTADPDGDGLVNLVECLLGQSPTSPPTEGPSVGGSINISGSVYVTLTFTHDPSVTGVQFQAEAATDLSGPWTAFDPLLAANQLSVEPNTPRAGLETIKIKDPQPVPSQGHRFLRLRIIPL